MQPDLRVLLFVFCIAYVFITALNFLFSRIYYLFRGGRPARSRGAVFSERLILFTAFVGFLCVLYGRYVEPYWPEVTHVELRSPKVRKESGRVRIVHISDVHSIARPGIEPRLPGIIAAEKPDLIVYTGDSVNDASGLPVFRGLMKQLTAIAPVYATAGNWDIATDMLGHLYENTTVNFLQGTNLKQDVRGTPIWIAGVSQWHDNQVWPSTRGIPNNEFSIFLFHFPVGDIATQRFDLYCAGHTHGGQVALPFYGALTTNSSYDKEYEAGLYRVKNTWMYVNRGIGMTKSAPRVRFLARPEITVIDVLPQS